MSAPTASTPAVPPQRRTRAATSRATKAKPVTKAPPELVEVPTERVPAPDVPPGVESPITVWGHTFDPELEPIGAALAVETASAV